MWGIAAVTALQIRGVTTLSGFTIPRHVGIQRFRMQLGRMECERR